MSGIKVSIGQLERRLRADAKRIEREVFVGIGRTAEKAVAPIRKRVPVAFGELRDSIQPADIFSAPKTLADAPHAGAVEVGTLPHEPDFEALLRWVKLRGAQGLTKAGNLRTRFRKEEGPTTPTQARSIARRFKALEVRGRRGVGRHSPIGAPEEVARRIFLAIKKNGTPPHWYVRDSLPDIREILVGQIKLALKRATPK